MEVAGGLWLMAATAPALVVANSPLEAPGACWLAVRPGIASPRERVGWRLRYWTALLCGIGFTMSPFIASLAFEEGGAVYEELKRLGILVGSLASGLLGHSVLCIAPRRGAEAS